MHRREKEAHATHWPPPLSVPQDLEDDEASAPEQFKCPITLAIMTEPALTPNGMQLPLIACHQQSCFHDARCVSLVSNIVRVSERLLTAMG